MRVFKLTLLALLLTTNILAQTTGTPSQLRVNVDANGFLVVASAAQTAPLTTTTFSNARLRVDANGNLVVAMNSGSITSPLLISGATPMIQLGGTTSSFPALKQNSSGIDVRLADDSGYARIIANQFIFASNIAASSGNILISNTPATISSGFGTSPTVPASNGSAVFTINVGTGGTASSGVIALPTATNGWACTVNMEAVVPTTLTKQSASTTNTVTLTNYTVATGATAAWAASTILTVKCIAR